MNKVRALEICVRRHLIQRSRESDKDPRGPPSDRYCDFHKDYGRTIEECRRLVEKIERVIRQGSGMKTILVQSVEENRALKQAREEGRGNGRRGKTPDQRMREPGPSSNNPRPMPQPQPQPQPSLRGVINKTSGGLADGYSNRAKKSNSWRMQNLEIDEKRVRTDLAVSFGPKNMKEVSNPYNDALVIRAMLSNYEVARIFVDSRSSVNFLFKEAMDQMDLSDYKIKPIITALFGFIGHAVIQ